MAAEPRASSYERLLQRYISGDYDGAVEEATRHSALSFEGPFAQARARAEDRIQFETLTALVASWLADADRCFVRSHRNPFTNTRSLPALSLCV